MKKILVSGCANCPYLNIWNNGEGNGVDSITGGDCSHPSFSNQLMRPRMTGNVFLHFDPRDDKVCGTKVGGTPDWCPLPHEIEPE